MRRRDYRGIAILLLAAAVGMAVLIFAALAIIDIWRPPGDEKLGRQAMTIGASTVAGAMSLIGVYIGMGAAWSERQHMHESNDKKDPDNQE